MEDSFGTDAIGTGVISSDGSDSIHAIGIQAVLGTVDFHVTGNECCSGMGLKFFSAMSLPLWMWVPKLNTESVLDIRLLFAFAVPASLGACMELLLGPEISIAFLCIGNQNILGDLLLISSCLEADIEVDVFGTIDVLSATVPPTCLAVSSDRYLNVDKALVVLVVLGTGPLPLPALKLIIKLDPSGI